MDLDFYVRVRTCKKRVSGKQPLDVVPSENFKPQATYVSTSFKPANDRLQQA